MKSILLIEDNTKIMRINTSALRMRGYRILQAFSLAEAEDVMQECTPDAILMEAVLPDGSGLDFCRRKKEEYQMPILFLSRLDKHSDIVAGLHAGGDDYLTKPHDLGVMAAKLMAQFRDG